MSTADSTAHGRVESDSLGERSLPEMALFGIHTLRARENFPLANRSVHPALLHAYGDVKHACTSVNRGLGVWQDSSIADAILAACDEVAAGKHDDSLTLDALQGGAGTSLNLAVCECIANRTLQLLSDSPGNYELVHPIEDINRHQSTNDTYPTALKLAAIRGLRQLETQIVALQESFQSAEKRFAHIVKVGRTEMQDAVLTTVGREMSAYAEALSRDRWRLYKAEERLRVVNLGGTAIGTGLGAPRQYIFKVVDALRERTGVNFARAENLVDGTQNADVFVEVSGLLKTAAATLIKISGDLRLLASGPDSGIGELILPPCQTGSSIMPGKYNPVIPEAVTQAGMMIIAYDCAITQAAASGSLELNPFLPLIADCLLQSIVLLSNSTLVMCTKCIDLLEVDENRCRRQVENSTAAATALLPTLGYERAAQAARDAKQQGCSLRSIVVERGWMSDEEFSEAIAPEAVTRLGSIHRNG